METIIILIALCAFLFLANMFVLHENVKLFKENGKLEAENAQLLKQNAMLRFEIEENMHKK